MKTTNQRLKKKVRRNITTKPEANKKVKEHRREEHRNEKKKLHTRKKKTKKSAEVGTQRKLSAELSAQSKHTHTQIREE